jgi:hypothetical protein
LAPHGAKTGSARARRRNHVRARVRSPEWWAQLNRSEAARVPLARALMRRADDAGNTPIAGLATAHLTPGDARLNPLLDSPPAADGTTIAVTATLHIINLSEINEVAESFHVNGYLIMHWHDQRLLRARSGGTGILCL